MSSCKACVCGAHIVDLITLVEEITEGLKNNPNYFSTDDKYFMRLGFLKPTLLQIEGPDGKPLSDEVFKELFHFEKPLAEEPDLFQILEDVQTTCEISTKEDREEFVKALKKFGSDDMTSEELRQQWFDVWYNIGNKLMDCASNTDTGVTPK